jgi:serine/threonine-protein kinase
MVLEYLCMNVGDLIGEGRVVENGTRIVPPRTALDFVRQTLNGLEYLHELGIVHLDVKPGNLMLGSDGTIKLIDLGLSRLRGEAWVKPRGLKIGSPYYAAPEQEDNPEKADARADLYAVGVVLHRLVSGLLPVDGLADLPLFSEAWREFFIRALTTDPDARFQDAGAMRKALDTLEADLQSRSDNDCVLLEPECTVMGKLRSVPLRTGVGPHPFDFLDELYRPLKFHEAELEEVADGWLDRCTGLVWGPVSPWPMTWDDGVDSVVDDWRMPTVEEVVSLLRPGQGLVEFCQRPFEDRYLWVWTGDRRSYTSAWFVDVGGGAVLAQDRSCRFHVRLVRSV